MTETQFEGLLEAYKNAVEHKESSPRDSTEKAQAIILANEIAFKIKNAYRDMYIAVEDLKDEKQELSRTIEEMEHTKNNEW